MSLSLVIITKNAERKLSEVLSSAQDIATEIIIVDSGSTDRTLEIAENFNAKIYQTEDFPGFGPQKRYALSLATQDWALVLDADEVISPSLKEPIKNAILRNEKKAYKIERSNNYFGKFLKYGVKRPDDILRLFPKGCANWSNKPVHENVELLKKIPIEKLEGVLWHYTCDDFETLLDKQNRYSSLKAEIKHKNKEASKSMFTICLKTLWAFIHVYIIKLGFLEGKHGFIYAVCSAESVYYCYLKLNLLNAREKLSYETR